jgi:hypothetical protein
VADDVQHRVVIGKPSFVEDAKLPFELTEAFPEVIMLGS